MELGNRKLASACASLVSITGMKKWILLLVHLGCSNGDRWVDYWTGKGRDALRIIIIFRNVIAEIDPGTVQKEVMLHDGQS